MNEQRIGKDMETKELAGDHLSALIDNELASREQPLLLARICQDPVSREKFGRYSLIGDAMRAGINDLLAIDLSGRVRAELGDEVTHQGGPGIGNHRIIRPLVGFAIAAGVAAMAIINLPGAGLMPGSESTNIAETASYTVPPDSGSISREPRVSARLAGYLMDHSEFSPSPVRRNVLYEIIGQEDATADAKEQEDAAAEPKDESFSQ